MRQFYYNQKLRFRVGDQTIPEVVFPRERSNCFFTIGALREYHKTLEFFFKWSNGYKRIVCPIIILRHMISSGIPKYSINLRWWLKSEARKESSLITIYMHNANRYSSEDQKSTTWHQKAAPVCVGKVKASSLEENPHLLSFLFPLISQKWSNASAPNLYMGTLFLYLNLIT